MNVSLTTMLCVYPPANGVGIAKPKKTLNDKATSSTLYSQDLSTEEYALNQSSTDNNADVALRKPVNKTQYSLEESLQKQKEHKSPIKVLFNTNAKPQLQAVAQDSNTNPAKPFFIQEMGLSEELVKFLNQTNASGDLVEALKKMEGSESLLAPGKRAVPFNSKSLHRTANIRIDTKLIQPGANNKPFINHASLHQQHKNTEQKSSPTETIRTSQVPDTNKNSKEPILDSTVLSKKHAVASKALNVPDTNKNSKEPILDSTVLSKKHAVASKTLKDIDTGQNNKENVVNSSVLSPKHTLPSKASSADILTALIGQKTPQADTSLKEIQNKPQPSVAKDAGKSPNHDPKNRLTSNLLWANAKNTGQNINESSEKLPTGGLSGIKIPTFTKQTQGPKNLSSKNSLNPRVDQIFSDNNPGTRITVESVTGTHAPKTSQATNAFGSVGEQLSESIQSSLQQGNKQIIIRLNPPELGKVSMRFQQDSEQISGLLEVSKLATKYEIQQALPQIIRNLSDSGIQVKRLEVILENQSDSQFYKDQSLHDGLSQHHLFTKDGDSDNTPPNNWLTAEDNYERLPQSPEALFTEQSINVLV